MNTRNERIRRTTASTKHENSGRLHLLNSCVVSLFLLTLPPQRGAAALLCDSVRCWATDVFPGNYFAAASARREVAKPALCTQADPRVSFSCELPPPKKKKPSLARARGELIINNTDAHSLVTPRYRQSSHMLSPHLLLAVNAGRRRRRRQQPRAGMCIWRWVSAVNEA